MISVVTVNYGLNKDLIRTMHSMPNLSAFMEHIVVASGLNNAESDELRKNFSSPFRKFIINQDVSIYNAMNIGLKHCTGKHVLFLNGGDTFVPDLGTFTALGQLSDSSCHAFRTHQIWRENVYIRPSLKKIKKLKNFPGHQGFLAPLNGATPYFEEKRTISADMYWMKECIKRFGVDIHERVVANFFLGGLSNYPTVSTIKNRLKNQGVADGLKEALKFSLRNALSDDLYYELIMIRSGCCKVDIKDNR